MTIFKAKHHVTFACQIRHVIGTRIIFCVALLSIAVFISSSVDFLSAFQQTKTALDFRAHSLSDYIVAQALINNTDAIKAELEDTGKQLPGLSFSWISTKNVPTSPELRWIFPFHWQYDYPISDHDGIIYGEMQVSGSYFYDHVILEQLLIKLSLLLFFSACIFMVLKPLNREIPQQLFIDPILDVLAILRNRSTMKNNPNLAEEFQDIQDKINELLEEVSNHSKIIALEKIAVQVAHDIRSPLLVLTRILSDLTPLPEKKRIDARHAIQRVTDIANNLLTQYKNKDAEIMLSAEPIAMMLESILSEKRIQADELSVTIELNIPNDAYNTFVQVDIAGFKRVISNLLNNAIEAVRNKKGLIAISLSKHNEKIVVSVQDNGCGIPKEKLPAVLEGESFGKNGGSGLGLPYAVKKISEWKGDYSLTSEIDTGTLFEIILPEIQAAEWFADTIQIMPGGIIVVLDDDNYIHEIWDQRFPKSFLKQHNISLLHFNNPQDFILFFDGRNIENITFLLDYKIGSSEETGLSLAAKCNIGKYSLLVTSRYEDNEIRESCKALGMKIIPKYFAEHIPIFITSKKSQAQTEVVFIDDDKTIAEIWEESAKDAGITLSIFHDPDDFIRLLNCFSKKTLIYIDSSLGKNLKGEDIAKILHEKGYTNIILASGYPKSHFQHVTWVKDVIEKNPPWG